MSLRNSIVAIAFVAGTSPLLAGMLVSELPMVRELPMYLGGTFVLENQAGDIELVGSDEEKVIINAVQLVRAADKDALEQGKSATRMGFIGDARMQIVRTLIPQVHYGWSAAVNYTIRVPRTVHVKIVSTSANRIHVSDIRGNVAVKSFNGLIVLDGVTGASTIDTANGTVIFNVPPIGLAQTQLSSVNGNVEVHAPPKASFQWVASTLKGDVRTTFPVRAIFDGSWYRGSINAPGGPTITTRSFMGSVAVLQNGTKFADGRSLRNLAPDEVVPQPSAPALPNVVQTFRQNIVQGVFGFSTLIGNIIVGEIRGNAKAMTGAGEVHIGSVYGNCQVVSLGGPVDLGDILGAVNARTEAGDVLVQSARNGGSITTGGGIIRLFYTGGPTRLQSGGGDIIVRQAAGPINAETQSGDISITVDPALTKEKIIAKTAKGNILIDVPPTFAADIDATVIASDPDVQKFLSDFSGLSVRREQIAGKTKIRATGKVNGGGERVELYAQDGTIQVTVHTKPTVTVVRP